MGKPTAVVLDVNETLFSLSSLQPVFEDLGISSELWFARTLRTGFALTCMGEYRTFPEVAASTLRALGGGRAGDSDVERLLEAFGQLRAHEDVLPAMSRLHESRIRVVTLSVGSAENVGRLFDLAGLNDYVDRHLSCEAVRRWKPAPEPYLYACERLGLGPHDVWMVAAHSWDVAGAASVGMRTAFVSRLEGAFDEAFDRPDVMGADLVEVVDSLLG